MLDSRHHVSLNGVKYRLAEDAEGEHYIRSAEPLRPPNAVMVQGTERQDQFQARPDMLLWSITDWAGGEGQSVVSSIAPNKHAILECVDPFIRPGTLTPGYDTQFTKDSGGSDALSGAFVLVKVGDTLVAVDTDADPVEYFTWNTSTEVWSAAGTWTDITSGGPEVGQVVADDNYIYVGKSSDSEIYKLALGTSPSWDLSLANYAGKTFDAVAQDTYYRDITFNAAGTAMYLIGDTNNAAFQYTLGTAWDVSTASYATKSLDVSAETTDPTGLFFGNSGAKVYVTEHTTQRAYQYSCSTPYDLSTATYDTKYLAANAQSGYVQGGRISADGTKMYIWSYYDTGPYRSMDIFQYTLSSAWDASTGAYASKKLNVDSELTDGYGFDISSDGTKVFVCAGTTAFQYTLGTAWDISTGTYSGKSVTISDIVTGAIGMAFGDSGTKVYFVDGAEDVWQYNLGTLMVATGHWQGPNQFWAELGAYLYVMDPDDGKLYEISKTGTFPITPTTLWEGDKWLGNGLYKSNFRMMVKGTNRLYAMLVSSTNETVILEIVPTSAAGTGHATEIARLSGFLGTALWYHSGTLYLSGEKSATDLNERVLMYLIPNASPVVYGAIGIVRPPTEDNYNGQLRGSDQGSFLLSPFTVGKAAVRAQVFMLDTVGGGYACFSRAPTADDLRRVVPYHGEFFVEVGDGVLRMFKDQFTITATTPSYATTPWNNMGLADEKILSSVTLNCEALPTNWSIILSYAVNGSSSFTTLGTYSTVGGTGTRFVVSKSTGTVPFRSLRIKIAFSYAGAGAPTTRPVVQGVDVRAQIVQYVESWQLLLDLSDDHGNVGNKGGAAKITNLLALQANKSVFAFLDGYLSRHDAAVSSDVILDSAQLNLSATQEGVAHVVLRSIA